MRISSAGPITARLLVGVAALITVVLTSSQATAHAHLVGATPASGGTVAPPSEIRLEFSEGVEPKFSGVTVTGAGGAAAALGAPSIEAGHQNVLIVPVAKPLSPGAYTVKWHALSIDTHRTQGAFAFTVK
jgi:methionine-rich copper-binding protein CopC